MLKISRVAKRNKSLFSPKRNTPSVKMLLKVAKFVFIVTRKIERRAIDVIRYPYNELLSATSTKMRGDNLENGF